MKLLVAGARGQVARSIVERAAALPGVETIAVGRPRLDLEQPGSAHRLIAEIAPDVVINAAAYTAVDDAEDESERAFRINQDGAAELAAGAAQAGAAIVHLSTDYVFAGEADGSYDENARPAPLNAYGRSKLAGERAVRAANARHVIVRTAWVYSPFGGNFMASMIAAAKSRAVLNVVDDQRGSPTSALDLADGLLALTARWLDEPQTGIGKTYHLAGPEPMTRCAFVTAVMEECRKHGLAAADIVPIASADWPAKAARPRNSALNSCSFARDFGYSMPPWRDSLAAVIERVAHPR